MLFLAYNHSTSDFIKIEVNEQGDIPNYMWNNGLLASDDDFQNWIFWPAGLQFKIEVETNYNFKEE